MYINQWSNSLVLPVEIYQETRYLVNARVGKKQTFGVNRPIPVEVIVLNGYASLATKPHTFYRSTRLLIGQSLKRPIGQIAFTARSLRGERGRGELINLEASDIPIYRQSTRRVCMTLTSRSFCLTFGMTSINQK